MAKKNSIELSQINFLGMRFNIHIGGFHFIFNLVGPLPIVLFLKLKSI